ncbi:hypothetical protein L484_012930 [Morus notabilis]|uniref:DUF7642 domain-containing protein n=1 Tax=Morus notabilis TaxID=981085 RepID=W9QRL5_9ROSA|nr:hypothetical protein L484_012930 [Morus notabilis]
MLLGHTDGLSELRSSSQNQLLADPESELDDDDTADSSEPILYSASFDELGENIIQYILRKDISSRKLYVTPSEIVYKVSRPSFIPFLGITTIEKRRPLSLVIDIIIEQGCLQSIYGIHTFRVESIAHGKAAPTDELQIQGVSDPSILRKLRRLCLMLVKVGGTAEGETGVRVGSLTEGPAILRSPVKSVKMTASPRYSPMDRRGIVPGDLLIHKLEEVNKSVKKLEFLIEKSNTPFQAAEAKSDPIHAEDAGIPHILVGNGSTSFMVTRKRRWPAGIHGEPAKGRRRARGATKLFPISPCSAIHPKNTPQAQAPFSKEGVVPI